MIHKEPYRPFTGRSTPHCIIPPIQEETGCERRLRPVLICRKHMYRIRLETLDNA